MSNASNKDLTEVAEKFDIPEEDPLRDMMIQEKSPWSVDDRLRACMLFQVTGSSKKVAGLTGIPDSTIRYWKTTSDWWPEASRQARKAHQEQLDAMMTGVIHRSIQEIGDRIENGNTKVSKNGEQYKIPVSSDELVRVTDKVYDKRALSRGDPTSRQEKVDPNEMLKNLFQQFESMVEKHHRPISVIDTTSIENGEYTEVTTTTNNSEDTNEEN